MISKNKLCIILLVFMSTNSFAQKTPDELGQLWIQAIKAKSKKMIETNVHPNCPKNSIPQDVLEKMVSGSLPTFIQIEVKPMNFSVLKMSLPYLIQPSHQLDLKFVTKTPAEKALYGTGKGFPVAEFKGRWYFTVCLKVK